jgi:L-seryl-tRNA(Ser) seleniumtransferase
VVLHTNLGRAPLGPTALARLALVATRYSNLELDVRTKTRGSRYDHVDGLLCRLSGAEAALVVNNNARLCCSRSSRSRAAARSSCRGAS